MPFVLKRLTWEQGCICLQIDSTSIGEDQTPIFCQRTLYGEEWSDPFICGYWISPNASNTYRLTGEALGIVGGISRKLIGFRLVRNGVPDDSALWIYTGNRIKLHYAFGTDKDMPILKMYAENGIADVRKLYLRLGGLRLPLPMTEVREKQSTCYLSAQPDQIELVFDPTEPMREAVILERDEL